MEYLAGIPYRLSRILLWQRINLLVGSRWISPVSRYRDFPRTLLRLCILVRTVLHYMCMAAYAKFLARHTEYSTIRRSIQLLNPIYTRLALDMRITASKKLVGLTYNMGIWHSLVAGILCNLKYLDILVFL
jgi:hypothetical protein